MKLQRYFINEQRVFFQYAFKIVPCDIIYLMGLFRFGYIFKSNITLVFGVALPGLLSWIFIFYHFLCSIWICDNI